MEIIDLPAGHPGWDQAPPVLQGVRFTAVFEDGGCPGVAGWRFMACTSAIRKLLRERMAIQAHHFGKTLT